MATVELLRRPDLPAQLEPESQFGPLLECIGKFVIVHVTCICIYATLLRALSPTHQDQCLDSPVDPIARCLCEEDDEPVIQDPTRSPNSIANICQTPDNLQSDSFTAFCSSPMVQVMERYVSQSTQFSHMSPPPYI